MAYVNPNFQTKKALKDAVASGEKVGVYQPNNMFGVEFNPGQRGIAIEGPHFPKPHKFYCIVDLGEDGYVCKVK